MLHLLLLFVYLLLAALLFFLGGKKTLELLKLNTEPFYAEVFLSFLAGITLFTSLSALYFTQFKSIFSLLLFLLLVLFLITKKENSTLIKSSIGFKFFKNNSIHFLPLGLLLLLLFGWFARLILDSNLALKLPANPENILYAQFAKLAALTGIENTFTIGYLPHSFPTELSPYHYFDLWFTAGISQFTGISSLECIHYFTLPLLNFIAILGILALWENLAKVNLFSPLWALMLLFVSGCAFFPLAEKFGSYQFDFMEAPLSMYGEKLSFAFSLFALVFLLFLKNKKTSALAILLLIPLLFPSLLTSIYLAVPILCIFQFGKKRLNLSEFQLLIKFQIATMMLYFLFYIYFGETKFSLLNATDFKGFNSDSFKMVSVEMFYRSWYKPFRSLLIYLPFFVLILISKRNNNVHTSLKSLARMVLLIYLAALITWALFYKMPEAWQIYTNMFVVIHLLIISFLIHYLFLETNSKFVRYAQGALLVLLFSAGVYALQRFEEGSKTYNYSNSFLNSIKQIPFQSEPNFCVAYIKNQHNYISTAEYFTGGTTAAYLQTQANFYGLINIGFNDLLQDSTVATTFKNQFHKQDFYLFCETLKHENKFTNLETAQLLFLQANHIHYVSIAANSEVPPLLAKNSESIMKDNSSGEKFLVLKNYFIFN